MNFVWKQLAEKGQYGIGFIDVYELQGQRKAIAIINYLPQHSETKQRVILTLILEGDKVSWTDGTLHSIFEDAEHRIKSAEGFKYNNFNSLDYMDTQILTIENLTEFDYLNHGDYTFLK